MSVSWQHFDFYKCVLAADTRFLVSRCLEMDYSVKVCCSWHKEHTTKLVPPLICVNKVLKFLFYVEPG
jgi:hypothetical protein